MPKKIIVQEIWIFNTRAHIDWAGRCVTPERRCAGSKIILHLSYFGLQMLQKGKNLQHCLLCRGFVIFMEIPIMSQLKGLSLFIWTTKKTRVSFYVSPSVCSAKSKPEASVCEGGGHAYFSSPGLCITHRDHSAHLNTVCPRTHV